MKIQSADYRIFPTTFLQNTVVSIVHQSFLNRAGDSATVIEAMNRFFLDNFQINFGVKDTNNTFTLSNNEADMGYMFTPTSSMLKVGRSEYKSFKASLMPHFFTLKDYVYTVLGVKSAETLRVRKVNMFPVKVDNEPTEAVWHSLREYLFVKELFDFSVEDVMEPAPQNAVGAFEKRIIKDDDTTFLIRTGITRMANDEHGYNAVLDISSSSLATEEGIIEEEVERMAIHLNKRLFDLFNFAVSDELKKILETEK